MKKQISREALFVTAFFLGALTVSVFVITGILIFKPEFMFSTDTSATSTVTVIKENAVSQSENTSAVTAKKNKTVQIDEKLQYELNIYLSNFSEVGFSSFKNSPSKSDQIDFATRHIYINRKSLLNNTDLTINETHCNKSIRFSNIAEIVKQYFGITITVDEVKNYPFYKDGYIYFNSSSVQASGFTIIDKIEADGNDKYTVSFKLYNKNTNDNDSDIYEYSESDAKKLGIKDMGYSGKAVISTKNLNDHSSFTLEYYSVSRMSS